MAQAIEQSQIRQLKVQQENQQEVNDQSIEQESDIYEQQLDFSKMKTIQQSPLNSPNFKLHNLISYNEDYEDTTTPNLIHNLENEIWEIQESQDSDTIDVNGGTQFIPWNPIYLNNDD